MAAECMRIHPYMFLPALITGDHMQACTCTHATHNPQPHSPGGRVWLRAFTHTCVHGHLRA